MPHAGEGVSLLLNTDYNSLKTKVAKSFLCDSRGKHKEGSETTVRKPNNQEAGKNAEMKHKETRGQRRPRPKVPRRQPFSQTVTYKGYNYQ